MSLVCVADSLGVRILVIHNIICIVCYGPMKGEKAPDDLVMEKIALAIIPWCSVKISMHNLE